MQSISCVPSRAPDTPPSKSVTCHDKTSVLSECSRPTRSSERPAAAAAAAAANAGGEAALGTNAKYSATPERIDPGTGEIVGGTRPYQPMSMRVQRFMLQSVSRKFLPMSRTNNCLRLRQGSKDIQVWQSTEHKTTSYAGLQTCGSVWACPVCSAKIAERRRAEIMAAMASHRAAGGCVNLLTLTSPHQRSDVLKHLLYKQAEALKFLFKDRGFRNIFAEMGVIGQIRALEVTHGRKSERNNGWHPHYHLLLFCGSDVDPLRMADWAARLYVRWAACCERAGLGTPSFAHGLKLDDGSKAANYVSKWGLEDEMTKGHTKRAIQGETPFDFLRAYLVDPNDKQAGALFKEFAETFKGKRQLHWSAGLKKHFAIGESSDEELASKLEDDAALLGTITLEQWRDVLAVEGRGNVLMVAANGGWEAVMRYLDGIKGAGKSNKRELVLSDSSRK
jgi:Replication protein